MSAVSQQLIDAAPTLLAACKLALVALKGREHDQFLRDAIAMAEGPSVITEIPKVDLCLDQFSFAPPMIRAFWDAAKKAKWHQDQIASTVCEALRFDFEYAKKTLAQYCIDR